MFFACKVQTEERNVDSRVSFRKLRSTAVSGGLFEALVAGLLVVGMDKLISGRKEGGEKRKSKDEGMRGLDRLINQE